MSGILNCGFHAAVPYCLHRLDHESRAHNHKLVVDGARVVVIFDTATFLKEDGSGIDFFIYHKGGDAGHPLPVYDGPVDGRGATVLGEEGRMEVECA